MPTRKRMMRDEALPQVKAQKMEHPKHSTNFSKRRNERFSVAGAKAFAPKTPKA
ncbi:MAG TPA: hypothetical protein VMZ25_01905 [Terriglobales bacterium]|nr:hypothetical protein [Terriglobales bacterium]